MTSAEPKTILANLVNEVMIESPPAGYARAMAAVTPRKLWLANPGDCVVTLAPCNHAFRRYVADITGVETDDFTLVAPAVLTTSHACDVVEAMAATDLVAARPILMPFVVDRRVLRLAADTGTAVDGYSTLPSAATLSAIELVNTKHGFRTVAAGLGLPVPEGGVAYTVSSLIAVLRTFLASRKAAIVKMNRSSNGYGTFVVTAEQPEAIAEQVYAAIDAAPVRRCGWVYEEYLCFTAAPSIEMLVDDAGIVDFYPCDQRTRNNAWTGMVTPAVFDPVRTEAFIRLGEGARRIGEWLHRRGYRGYFDVDGGLVDDDFVLTEANVRRTGGTYLEQLARRLYPEGPRHWRADARTGSTTLDFTAAHHALSRSGLCDPLADARALLLVDTLAEDGKWRYLVVGRAAAAVAAVEHELIELLELD